MSSPTKICMNGLCGATTTPLWKRGWPMKAGGFATLCYACGTTYDNVHYCERFHLNEPGWRECNSCEKPIHCGCVVSKYLHECLDLGGIMCIKCIRAKAIQPAKQSIVNEIPNGFSRFSSNWRPSFFSNRTNEVTSFDKGKLTQLTEGVEKHQYTSLTPSTSQQFKQEEKTVSSSKDVNSSFLKPLSLPSIFPTTVPDNNKTNLGLKSVYEPLVVQQPSGFAFGNPNSSVVSTSNGIVEGRVQEKVPLVKQEQKPRTVVPKTSKKGTGSDNRVGRPPAEGRGRVQLLPRYWPKITDQELLQISGDLNSNSKITPLFEKVLSASDAGRIGRLVLPKACAEAYFPAIDQSEGLPIKIRDIKGKEWTFQFRFWPNNNSRMYVLEGVTPCIQNMQLEAGDTVIFSRLDSEEKMLIGCRKAIVSAEPSALPTAVDSGALICTGNGNSPTNVEQEGTITCESVQQKKKARNIGSKNKRLHMNHEDAINLKFTWEEMQEFLRPPLSNNPTLIVIENWELEEYDEPPVFGKKTIFTTNASGLQEQWVECDSCSKWRKVASDVLIPSKWTCSDNVSDPNRCSCSAPEEKGVGDLNRILKFGKESKKRKVMEKYEGEEPQVEPTGLDALATVAVFGENNNESLTGPTTRHPRHRPGCTCIVCIQPPSGKGNHKPSCICNVCSTVRRRFKTLMLRKRKRQEADDEARKSMALIELGDGVAPLVPEGTTDIKDQELDLNCDPKEEEIMLAVALNVTTSDIPSEWSDLLAGLVPEGTSDIKEEKVIEVLWQLPLNKLKSKGGGSQWKEGCVFVTIK